MQRQRTEEVRNRRETPEKAADTNTLYRAGSGPASCFRKCIREPGIRTLLFVSRRPRISTLRDVRVLCFFIEEV